MSAAFLEQHAMPDLKALKLVGSSKAPSVNIPVEDFGTPGAHIELHIVPQFEGNQVSDEDVLGDTTQRAFRISARLSHAPSIIGHLSTNFGEKDGDSFLVVPSNADQLRIDTLKGASTLRQTKSGNSRLSSLNVLRPRHMKREPSSLTPSILCSITSRMHTTSLCLWL